MKTVKIRQNVFETNSSSTHSISIGTQAEGFLLNTLPLNDDGDVEIYGGEFGWEQDTYNDAQSKASYAMIYVLDWSRDKEERYTQILKDVIKNQTGAKDVVFKKDEHDKYYPYGYIDHQSVEDGDLDYLFEDPEQLRQFIFNPHSELETDNDNH